MLRVSVVVLVVYGGLLYLTGWSFKQVPIGFIPDQDQGYLFVAVQLPDAASLERTDHTMARVDQIVHDTEGVAHTIRISGISFILGANGSHLGTMFVVLEAFRGAPRARPERQRDRRQAPGAARREVEEAVAKVFPPPPVRGLAAAGGFRVMVEDRNSEGPAALQAQVDRLIQQGTAQKNWGSRA